MANYIVAILIGVSAQAQAPLVLPATNPPAVVQQRVGVTDVEIRYSRPGVKGRDIFGALVPYGQVWRTGADSATKIAFSTPVTFGGVAVPAGAYELFTIPGPAEWTVILQTNRSQWGSYSYDPAHDVARVRATPVQGDLTETLTIGVTDLTRSGATLLIAWARTRVPVRIEVDVVGLVRPRLLAAMEGDGRKPFFQAAMFYFEHDQDLAQAAAWMRAALAEQPGHIGMLHRLALILEKQGDREGALSAARQSLEGAATAGRELRDEYTRLNTALIDRLRRR